jgi:hypothetical protein
MTIEFYYCYSPVLYRYLRDSGIKYICTGLNENTKRQFWQYAINDELDGLLKRFTANKPK